ncbi:MAG: acyl-CoA oxidase [Saprospiraceae bacterium]|nr:acyl-CoA oxidase [Saprospiraceae bacterium]
MAVSSKNIYTPSVVSFIPLLYVSWADGLLSPSEVKIIKRRISSLENLTPDEREILLKWSDPKEWPDEATFKHWMELMKDARADLDDESIDSVVELGMHMASRAQVGDQDLLQQLRESLSLLSSELHIPGLAKFRALGVRVEEVRSKWSFSPGSLQKVLDAENQEVIERLKLLLTDPSFQQVPLRIKEEYRLQVLEWVKILARQGYGALGFPKAHGGKGDILQYAAVFETLSLFDLSLAVKFGVQFGLFGGSIQNLGSKKHHDLYLPPTGSADLLGCFAMTETGHGSNVRDLETLATYDHTTQTIDIHSPTEQAGKEYIGNALHASMASVFAQLMVNGECKGVHAILVPIRDAEGKVLPGIRIEDNGYKMGLNGVDNGKLWFDHVKVPRENLLNRFGNIDSEGIYESPIASPGKRFFTMLGTLVAGRICVAKGALGAAKVALTISIKYGLKRRQFGPDDNQPERLILDYPSHQRRLMPRLAKAYAAHFALNNLIRVYAGQKKEESRMVETMAAGLKSYVTWFANDAIQEGREACGGKGYLWENRFADLKADADIFATFEGDNTVLLQLVAKGLLTDFKEEFNAGGFMASIRYLASQVGDSFTSINPIYKRKTDADHLSDPAFHLHAFRFRERKLLYALGSRMRTMFKKRITPYDVFIRTQNHMIALAKAYVDRLVLEQFQEAISGTMDDDLVEPLSKLYTLFALSTFEVNKDWYLEQDYVEGVKTKAIRRSVDRLCMETRLDAEPLVDAFGIPDGILSAPIAIRK